MNILAPVPYGAFRNVVPTTNYPIGLNAANFMFLYRNIFDLSVGIVFTVSATPLDISATDLLGALNLEDNFGANPFLSSSIAGLTKRTTTISTKVKSNFALSDVKLSAIPLEYPPKHSIGGTGASFVLDFGDIIFYRGLYYPKIIINLNYAASNGAGDIIGGVKFMDFGVIPIYYPAGSTPLGPIDFPFADGTIQLNNRIDSITANKTNFTLGEQVILTVGYDISKYTKIYFDSSLVNANATNNSLTFRAPNSKFTGLLKLIKDSPYDMINHLELLTIK